MDVHSRKTLLDALSAYHPFWLTAAAEVRLCCSAASCCNQEVRAALAQGALECTREQRLVHKVHSRKTLLDMLCAHHPLWLTTAAEVQLCTARCRASAGLAFSGTVQLSGRRYC